jgi:hypothetical protein
MITILWAILSATLLFIALRVWAKNTYSGSEQETLNLLKGVKYSFPLKTPVLVAIITATILLVKYLTNLY